MLQTRYLFANEFDRFLGIFERYPHKEVAFKRKECLKSPCDKFRYNYLIRKGLCKVSVIHDSGDEKIIGYWGPGSIYPIICTEQEFLLEDSIIVTAMSDMDTWQFDTPTTKQCIHDYPDIAVEMIDHYCKFTNLLFFCATSQTYEDVKTRVCNMLLIYHQNLHTMDVPLSQSELASIIGAKRESVVKILRNLREDKIIATSRSHIRILSLDGLSQTQSLLLQSGLKFPGFK